MIRKISTYEHTYNNLVKQLGEFLRSRGIFTDERLSTMMEKFEEIESKDFGLYEVDYEAERNSPPFVLHSVYLAQEIIKRKKDFETRPLTQAQLTEVLRKMLMAEAPKANFLHVLVKYRYSFKLVPAKELVKLLENYCDPFEVSQENLFYLMNVGDAIQEIWLRIMEVYKELDLKQLLVVFKAMNALHGSLGKIYSNEQEKVPEEHVENLLSRVLEFVNEANLTAFCAIFDNSRELCAEKITENMTKLQIEMLNYPLFSERTTKAEIVSVVKNFPAEAVTINEHIIKKFTKDAEGFFSTLWMGDKIDVFMGMHKAGLKISPNLLTVLDEVDVEYLEAQPFNRIVNFFKTLAESKTMTENISRKIFESLQWSMPIETEAFEQLAELVYTTYKCGFGFFLQNEPNYLLRVSHPAALMKLQSMLQFAIIYIPSWPDAELVGLVFRTFERINNPESIFHDNLDLIAELQETLLLDSAEHPIFNYQIDSYTQVLFAEKTKLVHYVHNLIKEIAPGHAVVWKYFAEFIEAQKPELGDYSVQVRKENFYFICKAIWRFRPVMEVCDKVIENTFEMVDFFSEDYSEMLFYMAACKPVAQLFDVRWINQESVYYLALCSKLNIKPKISDKFKEIIKGNSGLFGEPLIESLVFAIKLNLDGELIKTLSSNLSFSPRCYPVADETLIASVVDAVLGYRGEINMFAFSVFINKHLEMISKEQIQEISEYFLPVIDQIFIGLKESLMIIGVIPGGKSVESPENDYKNTEELSEDIQDNIKSLKGIIKARVLNKQFIDLFVNSLNQCEDNSQALEAVQTLLELLSLFGNLNETFEETFALINKFSLKPQLSIEDLINFCFIYQYTTHNVTTDLLPYISPLLEHFKSLTITHPLHTSPQGLKYYSSFKYNTTYEPRFLTSNDISLQSSPPSLHQVQISDSVFLQSLKIYFLLETWALPQIPEVSQTIDTYFMNKTRLQRFAQAAIDIKASSSYNLGLNHIEIDREQLETPLSCLFHLVTLFKEQAAGMLLDDDMYIRDLEGSVTEIILPVQKLVEYFEKILKVPIQTFNVIGIKDLEPPEGHPFKEMLKRKNIYY